MLVAGVITTVSEAFTGLFCLTCPSVDWPRPAIIIIVGRVSISCRAEPVKPSAVVEISSQYFLFCSSQFISCYFRFLPFASFRVIYLLPTNVLYVHVICDVSFCVVKFKQCFMDKERCRRRVPTWCAAASIQLPGVDSKLGLTVVRPSLLSAPEPPVFHQPPVGKHVRQICGNFLSLRRR